MAAIRLKIFISSVQREFEQVRRDLKAFLLGDAALRRFVSEVFLFEDVPAKGQRTDELYLKEVERCEIYLGVFGNQYGFEDKEGVSPTEREYDHARKVGKTRLVFVWGLDDKVRHPKMLKLIKRASSELIRRRVEDESALRSEVYASIFEHLESIGALKVPPFDTATSEKAKLKDISRTRVDWFLESARRERGFALKPNTGTEALLAHLNLIENGKPANAAVLLFADNPKKFYPTAITKCVHCHGTEYQRPFASMQEYDGNLFERADLARDFVLSKINRPVGTRSEGITAPAVYELPPEAVGEAIVNAIAHRDYNSNASVEIRLFSNRLEVWNPGILPSTLSLDSLRTDHPSVPFNPLIAEPLYLARYIEKVGSGTQTIIDLCRTAGLPEPQFQIRNGSFVTTLWRDRLTDDFLATLGLNSRQLDAIAFVKKGGRIVNSELQQLSGATRKTVARDLDDLVSKGLLDRKGEKRGTYYILVGRK